MMIDLNVLIWVFLLLALFNLTVYAARNFREIPDEPEEANLEDILSLYLDKYLCYNNRWYYTMYGKILFSPYIARPVHLLLIPVEHMSGEYKEPTSFDQHVVLRTNKEQLSKTEFLTPEEYKRKIQEHKACQRFLQF